MGLTPHFAWVPRAGVGCRGCAGHSGDYINYPDKGGGIGSSLASG